jgi:putative two-component system response regulator
MREDDLKGARILIVDDDRCNVELLESLLALSGYRHCTSTTEPRQVLPLFTELQPDLILLDLMMPHLDGFAVMRQLGPRIPEDAYLPILVLTADATPEATRRALAAGAKDFLIKPFDRTEVLLRIRNLLETRWLHLELRSQNRLLADRVKERTRELEAERVETLERLALAAEFRDDDTGQHTKRVGRISALLARALGLPEAHVERIRHAAPLHDIGKIGIPDQILLKPGQLTPEEFEIIKTHTTIGAKILLGSRSPLLQMAEEIALTHHERWDGGGYAGLAGEAIPLAGRIVALADVFDALTHDRPYKRAWPVEEALAWIAGQRGRQFDPAVVEAFLRLRHGDLLDATDAPPVASRASTDASPRSATYAEAAPA